MHRVLFATACLLTACGGSVTDERTTSVPDSGATPINACGAESRPLTISVTSSISSATGSVTAAVTAVSADTIDLDACHPAADCVPMPIRLSVSGKDVALGSVVPVRAFVKLEWERSPTGWAGDTWRVMLSSVTNWGGMSNPAGLGDTLLLAANSGRPDPLPGAPFTITKSALDCAPTEGTSSCAYHKAYAYEIAAPGFPTMKVGMKERTELGSLAFENFEAWDSKCTDDYWHWSWLATRKPR